MQKSNLTQNLKVPKLKWVQAPHSYYLLPIYFVYVKGLEDKEIIAVRIEFDFTENVWVIDVCNSIHAFLDKDIQELDSVQLEAEKLLKKYLRQIYLTFKT